MARDGNSVTPIALVGDGISSGEIVNRLCGNVRASASTFSANYAMNAIRETIMKMWLKSALGAVLLLGAAGSVPALADDIQLTMWGQGDCPPDTCMGAAL